MMKYSFISTSQGGRSVFFENFIFSLENNTSLNNEFDYEVIFVDQSDGCYDDFMQDRKCSVKWIKTNKIALSKARNIALDKAEGDYVFFSDDDAIYDKFDFLILEKYLYKHLIINFPIKIAPSGIHNYGGRVFPLKERNIRLLESFSTCLSLSIVMKRDIVIQNGGFDERYGAGAILGGSEETDLILRCYRKNIIPYFVPNVMVMHPEEYADITYQKRCVKFYKYAIGYAKVCKDHAPYLKFIPYVELAKVMLKTFIALLIKKEKKFYFYRLKGFLYGLFQ